METVAIKTSVSITKIATFFKTHLAVVDGKLQPKGTQVYSIKNRKDMMSELKSLECFEMRFQHGERTYNKIKREFEALGYTFEEKWNKTPFNDSYRDISVYVSK